MITVLMICSVAAAVAMTALIIGEHNPVAANLIIVAAIVSALIYSGV